MEYLESYGNRKRKPDYSKCAANVSSASIWDGGLQCSRKASCDPNSHGNMTTCKQHSETVTKAREKKAKEKYALENRKWLIRLNGQKFYDALKKIADGHNDPRGLAKATLSKIDACE